MTHKIQKNVFIGDVDLAKNYLHEIKLSGQVISYNFVCHVAPEVFVTNMRSNNNSESYIRIKNISDNTFLKQTWNVVYFTLN